MTHNYSVFYPDSLFRRSAARWMKSIGFGPDEIYSYRFKSKSEFRAIANSGLFRRDVFLYRFRSVSFSILVAKPKSPILISI